MLSTSTRITMRQMMERGANNAGGRCGGGSHGKWCGGTGDDLCRSLMTRGDVFLTTNEESV